MSRRRPAPGAAGDPKTLHLFFCASAPEQPDLDGIEATRDIKAAYPLIEVILLTGHASMEASLEGMRFGAFDYLLKPVNIDELVYKIEDAHRKKELQDEKIRRLKIRAGEVDGDQETTD